MKLVVFGEDMYTAAVIESLVHAGHEVSLLVAPDTARLNRKVLEEITGKYGITFFVTADVNSSQVAARIMAIGPDLVITVHLRKILNTDILKPAKKGAINIHPSLLPKYRGLSPQHQAIMHGDAESGVSVHFIEEKVDTGDIVLQRRFSIDEGDYILQVQAKMLAIYKTIVVDAVALIEKGGLEPVKQDLSGVSYFGPLKKRDRQIDLSKTTEQVYNLIRSVSLPYKGAFYNDIVLWTAEKSVDKELLKAYPEPGLYQDVENDRILLRLRDGILISEDFEILESNNKD